jgi:hypothetical protein
VGLDMYAWAVPDKPGLPDFSYHPEDTKVEEFQYWRKHANLHGWMEALWTKKGGSDPDGFCTPLRLTLADLDALEADLRKLPHTTGFFFGVSPTEGDEGFEEQVEEDRGFIAKAREMIALGMAVYYDSSW